MLVLIIGLIILLLQKSRFVCSSDSGSGGSVRFGAGLGPGDRQKEVSSSVLPMMTLPQWLSDDYPQEKGCGLYQCAKDSARGDQL